MHNLLPASGNASNVMTIHFRLRSGYYNDYCLVRYAAVQSDGKVSMILRIPLPPLLHCLNEAVIWQQVLFGLVIVYKSFYQFQVNRYFLWGLYEFSRIVT